MKYYLSVIILSFILFLNSCIDPDYGILFNYSIKNNSNDTVAYFYNLRLLSINDTLLPYEKPNIDIERDDSYILKPFSSKPYAINGTVSSQTLQSYMDKYVMVFYFINFDSLNTLPWSKIREKNIYMKRVIIDTKQELDSCKYEITYP